MCPSVSKWDAEVRACHAKLRGLTEDVNTLKNSQRKLNGHLQEIDAHQEEMHALLNVCTSETLKDRKCCKARHSHPFDILFFLSLQDLEKFGPEEMEKCKYLNEKPEDSSSVTKKCQHKSSNYSKCSYQQFI